MTRPSVSPFVDETPGEAPVRGTLHRAAGSSGDFLVLTHGASGDSNAALLVAVAEEFVAAGIGVLRCDLPYRQRRPHGPPSPATAKEDQEGLRRAVTLMKEQFPGRAFLGGSSYGGRQATLLLASNPGLVEGLLLLSYPLHPPGKPAQLRTAHFPQLRTPSLFVSGTKDAFGTIDELQAAIKLIPARTELVQIDGGAHGLSKPTTTKVVAGIVGRKFSEFFA
ncbi:MAG: alpha/beta family hydrolase [Candidatus Korobacteraceae bacterium]